MSAAEVGSMIAAHEDAAAFYRKQLLGPAGSGPRGYLISRGFSLLLDDIPWAVGYAPHSWTALRDHLGELGYSDETLLAGGLVSRTRRGTLIDRFRDRITFGIRDVGGDLVGFTARRGPQASSNSPKYLNTRSTPIFTKGDQLFGLREAGTVAHPETVAITEGPLDAIAIAISAPVGAVAVCGTAFTPAHAELVTRSGLARVVLAFDQDEAGQRALESSYANLAPHVAQVRAYRTSSGMDPADALAQGGPGLVKRGLASHEPAIRVIVDNRIDSWPSRGRGAEADLCCLRSIAGVLARLQPRDLAEAAARLKLHLKLDGTLVTRELLTAATSHIESTVLREPSCVPKHVAEESTHRIAAR